MAKRMGGVEVISDGQGVQEGAERKKQEAERMEQAAKRRRAQQKRDGGGRYRDRLTRWAKGTIKDSENEEGESR